MVEIELLRVGDAGAEIPAVRGPDAMLRDLRSITHDIDGAFLASGGIAFARTMLTDLPRLPEGMRIGAPIVRPQAVMCIGQNYAAHAAESGDAPPTIPILFFKHPNTIVGPQDDVELPPGATTLDWEVELGIVIGSRAQRLPDTGAALTAVAGYVTSHDVSERTWQTAESGGQWSKGKSAPTFNPLGPVLVPADQVDPQSLRLWSTVNGDARQDSSTADMIFSVAELVHHLSWYVTLEPGDLINTGTPQGVAFSGKFPYLRAGDVVELGIDGLGQQRQRIVTT